MYANHPNTQEAEAGRSQVSSQPDLLTQKSNETSSGNCLPPSPQSLLTHSLLSPNTRLSPCSQSHCLLWPACISLSYSSFKIQLKRGFPFRKTSPAILNSVRSPLHAPRTPCVWFSHFMCCTIRWWPVFFFVCPIRLWAPWKWRLLGFPELNMVFDTPRRPFIKG